MILINESDLEKYRYAVGKVCFLETYYHMELIEDSDTNCMWVYDRDVKEKKYIAIFRRPEVIPKDISEIYVYYERAKFKKYSKEEKKGYVINCLDDRFDELYQEYIVAALMNPKKLFEKLTDDYFIKLFSPIIESDKSNLNPTTQKCFKYWNQKKVQENKRGIADGKITFCNPSTFNDPFDCNCVFNDDSSLSDKFRIFCTAPSNDNILLWSYYGDDHKGYCFRYDRDDIVNAIFDSGIDGICIVGKVKYKRKRPKQKSAKTIISYSEIKFYIEAAFTKFINWNHEEEYRFVIISDEFNDLNSYYTFQVLVEEMYVGCKGVTNDIVDSTGKVWSPKQLNKHPVEYELI